MITQKKYLFQVEEQSFSAHRIVLAAVMPYFNAMFTNGMVESKQREITMQGIEPGALESLINFAYSGKIKIDGDNVQSLLVGSSFLQLLQVKEACANFLINRFSLAMRIFLQVFETAMSWVKRDERRIIHLPEILKKIRMPLLTPEYLSDRVATENLIRSSHECRDLLDEAKDYHLMPERRPLLQNFRTRPRCCNDIVGLIYAVGGITKSGDSLSTVEVFDPVLRRWEMAESMSMLRSRVGVVVMDKKLYAIGGYDGHDRLATVEVFDGLLYVCGGYDGCASLNTVECYRAEDDAWRMLTSMSNHRSAAGVVAFDGHVYAMGGHDGLSIFDSVERYNPTTACWSAVAPMLSKRCRLGAATLNGKLYVCGGYDGSSFLRTVEVFDPITSKWSFVAPMNVSRSRVALVANMGLLYAIGGYDGCNNLSTVEVYNPETDKWDFISSMCAHEGGVGVGVIPCPTER
ncbi:hypothetical protein HAZT_HAZT000757 [Hyalella azteca]|uniref:BTB domain-containing protein n=1 Tax=Hyalella azteca TaxID=294128 RepID=A0A6A0HD44_HYAAZ|nr:hypothetical protein HAZT_HAZT000757 [Hyalella azteca]